MAVDRLFIEWEDNSLGFVREGIYLAPGGNPAAILAALNAMANAQIQQWTQGPTTFTPAAALDALYPLATVLAQVAYNCADGTRILVSVPAPLSEVFTADQRLVNPLDAKVAALTAALTGVAANNLGSLVTGFNSGVYVTRRRDIP